MIRSTQSSPLVLRNLEERLAPRRAAEASGYHGGRGGNPLLVHCNWALTPLLRFALQIGRLYQRGLQNALNLQVRYHRLSFPNLPAHLDGFRLLQLSDLHIDGVDGLAEVLCQRLSGLSVDLCVLTGDYRFQVAGSCDGVYPRMRTVLGAVRSRLGVAGILGNHDCADMAPELERLGVRMLINENLEVERGFWVTGADEADDGVAFRESLRDVPPDAFHLVLVHTPQLYAEADAAGAALYLCGHTHAGQICLPGGRPLILNARCPREYAGGLWQHGKTVGFTSSGAGCSMLPIRYNCLPEISVFELIRS